MKNTISKLVLLLAAAWIPAGCAPTRPVAVAPQVETADNLYGNASRPTQPPPDDQQDVQPPSPGLPAQWWFIPGHWAWRGQWVWLAGHWRPRPHSGDVWLKGKWTKQGEVYVWQKGHWRSGAHFGEESNGSD